MKTKLLFCLLGTILFLACENNPEITNLPEEPVIEEPKTEEPAPVENPVVVKEVFTGYAQKGPFINGSSILISELDTNLNQTGRVYSTRIESNSGTFEQKNMELVSNFVELKADGYYFDEVSGKLSEGQITLYALVDVSEVNSANVNVLTHLIKPRVEYLVKQENLPFQEAKKQAQKEVLSIFNIELPEESADFESFNLTQDAVLVAVSSILQGYSPTADVMQLMADVSNDIKADGTLDDLESGSNSRLQEWVLYH